MVGEPVTQPDDGRDARSASELVARLVAEFPAVDPDRISALAEVSLGRTSGARVQNYRLVLAEREVREQLRRGQLRAGESARQVVDQEVREAADS